MKKEDIKNKKFIFVILLTVLLLFVPLVSSDKIIETQTNVNGYQIFYPDYSYVQQGKGFFLAIHLSNFTNGFPIQNTNVNCFIHLVNTSGQHTAEDIYFSKEGLLEHIIYIIEGNFSDVGTHGFFISCNDTNWGGQAKGSFEVTPSGENLTEGTSTIYVIVTIFAFLIFALLLFLFIYIDGKNPKNDETGDIVGVNYKKYVKTSIFPLVYVSFIWFFNFIIGLSNNFLGLTLYANTLEFMFLILIKLTYPILIITFVILLALMVKDGNIKKEYKSLWNRY